jgi:polyisoprenoid-binding protein YceI
MKFRTIVLLLAMAVASPAFGQTAGPSTDLSKIEGGVFNVDKKHAKIIFSYGHFGYSTSYGLFTDFDAKLTFDPKAPTSSTLTATINLDGIETMVAQLNAHLKTPDFFDTAKFASASFKSTKVTMTGPTTGAVTGDLTLHGVTKPITLEVTFNGGGVTMAKVYVLGFSATGHLKRSDFGIGAFVPMVSDDVVLTISSEFDRVPS